MRSRRHLPESMALRTSGRSREACCVRRARAAGAIGNTAVKIGQTNPFTFDRYIVSREGGKGTLAVNGVYTGG